MTLGVHKVVLIGNLGKNPERQCFFNGEAFCNAMLASSKRCPHPQTREKKATSRSEWA